MASLGTQARPEYAKLTPQTPPRSQIRALVVSSELETRKPLLQTLESLGVEFVACCRRLQAQDTLSKTTFDVIFCDERLPDGSYVDLIHVYPWDKCIPRVIVTTPHGDWDLYFQALEKGAFDVIRCPCYPTDVEMVLIRLLREGNSPAFASA